MTMTGLENRLYQLADINPDFSPLYESWVINKRTLEKFMQLTIGVFPHYSLHDATHCKSVLNNIEMLLGNDRINEFSPTDIWLLLNSIYAHDIGMVSISNLKDVWSTNRFQDFINDCKNGGMSEEFKQHALAVSSIDKNDSFGNWSLDIHLSSLFLLAEYYRKGHSQRSAESISSSYANIDLSVNNLIPYRLISWVSRIVQSHGEDFQYTLDLCYQDNGFCRDYIHPRFLSALLCLGDALDMDNARFHPYSEIIIGGLPESSNTHRSKHESIRQLRITPECIEITADCGKANDYHATYRVLRDWCEMLKQVVENISLHWHALVPIGLSGFAPTLTDIKYYVEGEQINPALAKLKFNITQKRAFELIQGSNIYNHEYDFLRELIQNAMDASKIQFWRDIQDGCFSGDDIDDFSENLDDSGFQPYHVKNMDVLNRYTIKVLFEALDNDIFRITVQDSGTGFTEDALKEMSQAGQSYRSGIKKETVKSMPSWLKPTGNFGIGLQSVFLACNQFKCKTRSRESGISYDIIFHSRNNSGYLDVIKTKENYPYGTTFIVECKNNKFFSPINYRNDLEMAAYNIYNEINYFTKSIPSNTSAQIGTIDAFSYISQQMSDTLIPVILSIDESPHQKHNVRDKVYDSIKKCKEEGVDYDKEHIVYFDKETLGCFIWNKKDLYYNNICPGKFTGRIYFKDIEIPNARIGSKHGVYQTISLFGYQADDLLELNRSKLLDAGKKITNKISDDSLRIWKNTILNNFDEVINFFNPKTVHNQNDLIYINYVWYICLLLVFFSDSKNRKENLEAILECNCDFRISGCAYIENEYKQRDIDIKELFKDIINEPNVQFFLGGSAHEPFNQADIKQLNTLRTGISNIKRIFRDGEFENYLDDWYDREAYFRGDIVYFKTKTKNIPQFVKCDFKEYLRLIVKHNNTSLSDNHIIFTNCISHYEKLSLNREKIKEMSSDFWLSVNQCYLSLDTSYMIFPLSCRHLVDVKNGKYTEEVLTAELTSSPTYLGIVQFTVENQFETSQYSESEITKEYEKLISDIFNCLNPSNIDPGK